MFIKIKSISKLSLRPFFFVFGSMSITCDTVTLSNQNCTADTNRNAAANNLHDDNTMRHLIYVVKVIQNIY